MNFNMPFDKLFLVSLYETIEAQLNVQAAVFGLSPKNLEKYYVPEEKYDIKKGAPMSNVFERFLLSLQNRQNLSSSIRFHFHISAIRKKMFNFDVKKIASKYSHENAEKTIYDSLLPICQWNPKADSPRDWCRGFIEGARQLAKFEDSKQMFIEIGNVEPSDMVIYWLKNYRIKGMGYALTCDFLKEIGFDLPKPDRHIKLLIDKLFPKKEDEIRDDKAYVIIFLTIVEQLRLLKIQNLTAYKLDKMIWLVCTNSFYLDSIQSSFRENLVSKILSVKA